jgi:hypothetical protein
MERNVKQFQESITKELVVIKDRVRNLIGDAHWGEEGRYKEIVLRNVLRRFLPNNLSIGTGFIVNANTCSKQIDIIIYDNTMPLLFSEGDFIITTHLNVKGIIEVKSKITPSTLTEIIRKFDDSIQDFICEYNDSIRKEVFLGIFAFEFRGNINSDLIDSAILSSRKNVNNIALGHNYFIKKWSECDIPNLIIPVDCEADFYNLYNLPDLSFSYFISNLIGSSCNGIIDRDWFSFPIEGTKEINRLKTICER